MSKEPWWAEPFDFQELRRHGFTLQEVRELERIRMAAVPEHERKAAEAAMSAYFDPVEAALEVMRRALMDDDVTSEELEEDAASMSKCPDCGGERHATWLEARRCYDEHDGTADDA